MAAAGWHHQCTSIGMPSNGDDRAGRSSARAVVWVIVMVVLFIFLVILALIWRSAWWSEAGSPIPRGTERQFAHPESQTVKRPFGGCAAPTPISHSWRA
jgi:hypothetical protein